MTAGRREWPQLKAPRYRGDPAQRLGCHRHLNADEPEAIEPVAIAAIISHESKIIPSHWLHAGREVT